MKSRKELKGYLPGDTDKFQHQALQAEKSGEWPEAWLDFAADHKLFHLAVPEAYGGRQLSLPDLMTVFEEAAKLDGSFGWSLTLAAGAGPFTAYMDPDFAAEFFSDGRTFIAGTGFPGGTFHRQNKGVIASGRWKYITGAPHASLFTAVCESSENKETKITAFLPSEVTIDRTWNSYGLKATASHDISVDEVTVPEERIFSLEPGQRHIDEPLFRFPFEPFARATLAATFAGIGGHFINEAADLLESKENYSKEEAELIEKTEHQFQKDRGQLWKAAEKGWQECLQKEYPKPSTKDANTKATFRLVTNTLDISERLYRYCGMAVLNENTVINRAWRDLHTACQHTFLQKPGS